MRYSHIFENDSARKVISIEQLKIKEQLGLSDSMSSEDSISALIQSFSSLNPFSIMQLVVRLATIGARMKKVAVMNGVDSKNITKVKLNVLSILSLIMKPDQIDDFIASISYEDNTLDFPSLMSLTDDQVCDLIFLGLKDSYPMISMLENSFRMFINKKKK